MSATLGCSIKLAEPTAVQLAQLIAWLVDGVQPGNQKLGPSWGKTWTHGAGLRATFRFAGVENGLQLLLLARGSSVRHEMSATVLLFAHDFGSPSELTNFLVVWLRSMMIKPPAFCPRVLLITEEEAPVDVVDLRSRLTAGLLSHLCVGDPTRAYTAAEIHELMRETLRLDTIEVRPGPRFGSSLLAQTARACNERQVSSVFFSALHWKALFKDALTQYARSPPIPISFCRLSRLANAVPVNMAIHLAGFLQATALEGLDQATILASALSMNACPPGMYQFSPDIVYSDLYKDEVLRAASHLKAGRPLALQIEARFISSSTDNLVLRFFSQMRIET
ncbi:uncharacterized protein VDAG_04821 [Verticillium dahliae VdLs.17]|uniref:Uncharacterized protein n=1 Tax=Verticillium dahliae (strain VdLs.17 / ATCC MYA-4575 / FGSC 10137) TaxID=498257 RepID=G2X336_VERDV|nr:uncharacterized protein VDAG_04821 [Verticillium dahliae VdLs.17]EGY23383.1 hypothetical protein VDAG_04821 [Verticillium dahliae VdLs.17]KAH6691981.1 hypothetical protein EV126DRAFT_445030 [Verticillium dahliae]